MRNKRRLYSTAEKYPEQPTIPEMPDISQRIIKIKAHYECQYYLPCGVCDKSGEQCDMIRTRRGETPCTDEKTERFGIMYQY